MKQREKRKTNKPVEGVLRRGALTDDSSVLLEPHGILNPDTESVSF